MTRVVHVITFVRSQGGMQGIVRRQSARDAALGHAPEVAALFEPSAPGGADTGLPAAWWWTPAKLRRRFAALIAPRTRGALVIYHNAWGLPLLAPGDGALRRVAFLHTDWPALAAVAPAFAPWCDLILCVNDDLAAKVRRLAPDFPSERVAVVPYPVEPPENFSADNVGCALTAQRGATSAPPTIAPSGSPARESRDSAPPAPRVGFVARLELDQKRVDRLPALMRQLAASAPRAEWHILGDGRARASLERATRGLAPVTFHGWLSGADYWHALAALAAVVFVSDYEGTPIAQLEAMSLGALPLFPAIGGAGETYARAVDARCVYLPGDLAAAARQLASLLAAANLPALRALARAAVAAHTPAAYEAAYAAALRATLDRPRHSLVNATRPARLSDLLPLAAVRRFYETALWR